MKIRPFKLCAGLILLGFCCGAPAQVQRDPAPKVLNGIDVLRRQNFAPLAGKRVGLITNQTGIAADGAPTIDLFFKCGACKLVALFSPEHGIRGAVDEKVASGVDTVTGLPVYSLYGETLRPSPEMLRDIDVLVYDIQDVGVRFYTYETTMAYCMEEAGRAKIPFYLLDRPNPIDGMSVEGPMLDPDKTSFVGYMPLPVRHGMTMGELARYINAEKKIGADLHVVAMEGWRRSFYFSDTGQLWVNPSPNMRSLVEAIFYPGICLLESTNVSVGRGTDTPFERIGAPWIEPRRLAAALQAARLPGVDFVPVSFTPASSTFRGQPCGGVNLMLTDRSRFQSVLTGLTLISILRNLYPSQFEIDKCIRLLGNQQALDALKKGILPSEIMRSADAGMRDFLAGRQRALIYER
jgi:uncharacterized protein YbbC (DUF1343 family)